jgi:acetyltransferase
MAGTDAVYDAALRQCGAIRVHTIEEAFDLCKALVHVPSLGGKRVAIVTNSGGPGVMAADRAEEVGLDVAEPSDTAQEKLVFLPPQCALKNPIDLTVEGTEEGYKETLLAIADEYDAILALNIAPAYLDSTPLARGVCDAAEQTETPIVAAFLPQQIVADAVDYLQGRGMPNFLTGERAVTALANLTRHGASRHQPPQIPDDQRDLPGDGQMLEHEAMAWLQENGIPIPDFRFAATLEAAVRGCGEIGYPVVMKVVSPEILHKSDYGGVVLNIKDDQAAQTTFEHLAQIAKDRDFRGVVIYPMIKDAQEVLMGISRDPQFGPVVAFGLGGIYTETWRDITLRVARRGRGDDPRDQVIPATAGSQGPRAPGPGCPGRHASQILRTPLPLSRDRRDRPQPCLLAFAGHGRGRHSRDTPMRRLP